MRLLTLLIALAMAGLATAQGSRGYVFPPAWGDPELRASMEVAGWQFRTTLGIPERLCYAMPPTKEWPHNHDWADPDVRSDAVTLGALRFPPRADGKCYAADAHG
jgi:hypothetical protein